jgi:hypothetical protein
MNERIRELARRVVGKNKNDVDSISLFDDQIDQFTKLIVQECAEISENYAGGSMPVLIACAIKEHFGVEE